MTPLLSNQIWYNLADRSPEFSLIPACRDQQVSIIVWGALAQSFLTGRFSRDRKPDATSRFASNKEGEMCSWEVLDQDRNWNTLAVVTRIAEAHGTSPAVVAMRWLLQFGAADVVLLGCSRVEQFAESLAVTQQVLRDDEMDALRQVSDPYPHPYPNCFWEQFCYEESPDYGGVR